MSQEEHPKYLAVLPQFKLTPDQVPAEIREGLYKKLGLELPSKSAKKSEPDLAKQIIEKTKQKKSVADLDKADAKRK